VSLWELSSYFATSDSDSSDETAAETNATTSNLNKFIHAFQEIIKLQNTLVDQVSK